MERKVSTGQDRRAVGREPSGCHRIFEDVALRFWQGLSGKVFDQRVPAAVRDRRDHRGSRLLYTRYAQHGLADALEQCRTPLGLHRAATRTDVGDEDGIRIVAEADASQSGKRLDEESAADHQHQRERDLRDDERAAEPESRFADDRTSLRLERFVRFDPRAAQRRHRPEDQGGRDGHGSRERQHPPVRCQVETDRVLCGR